jgi:carboxypeptidase Taq
VTGATVAMTPYKQLEQEWKRLHAFRGAMSLLRWDAAVMMPRGSSDVRGEQLAALETEHHALLTAPKVTRLLDRAQANTSSLEDPVALISRLAKATSRAEVRWVEARQSGKFELFAPHLEEVLHLVRDKAQLLGQALHLAPYDALLDEFSPGITAADIDGIFKGLARRLPGFIRETIERQEKNPSLPIVGRFAAGKQKALAVEIMKAIGFPFDRGRLDESEHAFTEGVPGDVRVTTRFDSSDLFPGLLGGLHETGHAMYDLGLPADFADQPVGRDRGMALEESQSLLIEMIICRSKPFLAYLKPLLEKHFAVNGPEWSVENLYAHLTRVRRSAIRVDADEPTYPMHIQVRYELEKRLLGGELAVRNLPEAWNAIMEQRLGVKPANDIEGCLQDVHWAVGSFGYFPSYAVGYAMAAQFYERIREAVPELDEQLARGEFAGLFGWLREHVHSLGARVTAHELVKLSTGKPLGAAASLRYLESKYLGQTTEASIAAA